jgi:hypothetical protein
LKKTALVLVIVALVVLCNAAIATALTEQVTVTAAPQAKLTLSLDKTSVSFGNVQPGTSYPDSVSVTVNSNKAFTLTKSLKDNATIGFTSTIPLTTNVTSLGSWSQSDSYALNVPYSYDIATPISFSLSYSAVQD